ncbi:MAG: hypothetical protein HY390_03230 [Deltaproteobacteria bacterium]|nr:hypothetical protein [Deltaproteobacteria bacterium]
MIKFKNIKFYVIISFFSASALVFSSNASAGLYTEAGSLFAMIYEDTVFTEEQAKKLFEATEKSWSTYTKTWGFQTPEFFKQGYKLNIYLVGSLPGSFFGIGSQSVDTKGLTTASIFKPLGFTYFSIPDVYIKKIETEELGALYKTLFHELFHVVQGAYPTTHPSKLLKNRVIMESTAEAMAGEMTNELNLGTPGYLEAPYYYWEYAHEGKDLFTILSYDPYRGAVFLSYLFHQTSLRQDNVFENIKTVLELMVTKGGSDALTVEDLHKTLEGMDPYEQIFPKFITALFTASAAPSPFGFQDLRMDMMNPARFDDETPSSELFFSSIRQNQDPLVMIPKTYTVPAHSYQIIDFSNFFKKGLKDMWQLEMGFPKMEEDLHRQAIFLYRSGSSSGFNFFDYLSRTPYHVFSPEKGKIIVKNIDPTQSEQHAFLILTNTSSEEISQEVYAAKLPLPYFKTVEAFHEGKKIYSTTWIEDPDNPDRRMSDPSKLQEKIKLTKQQFENASFSLPISFRATLSDDVILEPSSVEIKFKNQSILLSRSDHTPEGDYIFETEIPVQVDKSNIQNKTTLPFSLLRADTGDIIKLDTQPQTKPSLVDAMLTGYEIDSQGDRSHQLLIEVIGEEVPETTPKAIPIQLSLYCGSPGEHAFYSKYPEVNTIRFILFINGEKVVQNLKYSDGIYVPYVGRSWKISITPPADQELSISGLCCDHEPRPRPISGRLPVKFSFKAIKTLFNSYTGDNRHLDKYCE